LGHKSDAPGRLDGARIGGTIKYRVASPEAVEQQLAPASAPPTARAPIAGNSTRSSGRELDLLFFQRLSARSAA
jgi:hypothetical protein